MCLFSKKKKKTVKLSRELLQEKYAARFEMARNLAQDNETLFSDIDSTRAKYATLPLMKNEKIVKIDDSIYEKIDELFDAMNSHYENKDIRAREILAEIEDLIIERKHASKGAQEIKESDFIVRNGVLEKYVGNGGDIVLPKTIKEIGEKAFDNNQNVSSVVIPEGVTTIRDQAFAQCAALKVVEMPSTLVSIGKDAFFNCKVLTNVYMQNGVISIDYYAFARCENLKLLKLPKTVTAINDHAFERCKSLSGGVVSTIKKINKQAVK